MTSSELAPDALKAIETIKKLLNLAAKAGTPEEAASATAKAQEMLAKFNLSTETVDRVGSADGKREQAAVDGGFYAYQRRLWRAVAELNFCVYWAQQYRVVGKRQIYEKYYDEARGEERRRGVGQETRPYYKTRHVLVGRVVNVRATIAMAGYLSQAVERVLAERLPQVGVHRVSNWAVSWREGAVASIVDKLRERRAAVLDEEEARERAAQAAAMGQFSTSTALSLARFSKTEEEANADFIHGEGYSARKAAARAEAAREHAEQEAAYTRWAAANPEEARKKETERRAELDKIRRRSRGSTRGDNIDWGAFRSGRDAGEKIGLDAQVDAGKHSKVGGGR